MLVLWEEDNFSISAVCERLKLDTSTISPLIKRLEGLKLVKRKRSKEDECSVRETQPRQAANSERKPGRYRLNSGVLVYRFTLEEIRNLRPLSENILTKMDQQKEA